MPPEFVSSASTFQGSRAWRSFKVTPSAVIDPIFGKRNSKCDVKPAVFEVEARRAQVGEHFEEVPPDEVRQHEAVVQRGAPADQAACERLLPEQCDQGAHQQHLQEPHAEVRRHLERAQLKQAEPQTLALGRVHLVDAELRAMRVAGHIDQEIAKEAIQDVGWTTAFGAAG